MTDEIWRDVLEREGLYEVSNLGRVRRSGAGINTFVGKVLKPGLDPKGYAKVVLSGRKIKKVHHLVLEAFVRPRPDGLVCNHKNGVKNDNRLDNLEWVTPSENTQHGFDVLHRISPKGEAHWRVVLNQKKASEIVRLYETGRYSQWKLAGMFEVGRSTIQRVVSGASWR